MNSKLAILLPVITLVYLFQTMFLKRMKGWLKFPLTLLALALLVFDVFVYLVFLVNCIESGGMGQIQHCIHWIYPTLDFEVMIIASVLLLVVAFWGLLKQWTGRSFYALGSAVLYFGVAFRVWLLIEAAEAINIAGGASGAIVFEIFSIVVVYGLVSSALYFSIFFLGMFTKSVR